MFPLTEETRREVAKDVSKFAEVKFKFVMCRSNDEIKLMTHLEKMMKSY